MCIAVHSFYTRVAIDTSTYIPSTSKISVRAGCQYFKMRTLQKQRKRARHYMLQGKRKGDSFIKHGSLQLCALRECNELENKSVADSDYKYLPTDICINVMVIQC